MPVEMPVLEKVTMPMFMQDNGFPDNVYIIRLEDKIVLVHWVVPEKPPIEGEFLACFEDEATAKFFIKEYSFPPEAVPDKITLDDALNLAKGYHVELLGVALWRDGKPQKFLFVR